MPKRGKLPGRLISMPSVDDLFSTEEERQDAQLEKVKPILLSELHPFKNHPFEVRDDEEMQNMVESVKEFGILTPAIVRPRQAGGYEIVSGHRRTHAAVKAGLTEIPAIIREMDDDKAICLMVDSNLQREHITLIEKAKALDMKLEAKKRQGARTDLTSGQVGQKLKSPYTVEIVADEADMSVKQVQRLIRLLKLTPELQQMVNDGKLKMHPAVEISYLTPSEQREFYEYIDSQVCTPSLSQAQRLKAASKEGAAKNEPLTEDLIASIMEANRQKMPTKQPPYQTNTPTKPQLVIDLNKISHLFPAGYSIKQMELQIINMLTDYARQREIKERHTEIEH